MSGFTLVELIIVVVVTGIMIGLLFGPLNDLYTANNNSLKTVIQSGDTKGSLRTLEEAVTMAVAFLDTNSADDPTVSKPASAPDWAWASGDNSIFILSNYATSINTAVAPGDNRKIVHTAADCNVPLMYNYVYFLDNGTLYRRTLMDGQCGNVGSPNYVSPTDRRQKRTCALPFTSGLCEGADAKILINVSKFNVTYYDAASLPMSTPVDAKSVGISVTTTKDGRESTSTIRFKRVNGN